MQSVRNGLSLLPGQAMSGRAGIPTFGTVGLFLCGGLSFPFTADLKALKEPYEQRGPRGTLQLPRACGCSAGGGGVHHTERKSQGSQPPFPRPRVYFGSGQQALLGREEPHGARPVGRHLKTTGLVRRGCKMSLPRILSWGWAGHGGLGTVPGPSGVVCRTEHTQIPSSWQTRIS